MVQHDLSTVAFPRLTEAQLALLAGCCRTHKARYRDGQKLVEPGQHDFKFFVVRSGGIDVVDESGEETRLIRSLGPGEFTGEISMLTGGPALITLIARGDC